MSMFRAFSLSRAALPVVRAPVTLSFALTRTMCTTQTFLDKAEVTDRVVAVLKNFEKVEASKVSPSASFTKDLGLDSLDQVEVCMALEEEFCIAIPDADAEKILSTEDAISFIATHPQAK